MPDWTEKHRPATLAEVRGNDSARDELHAWADNWPDEGRAVILAGRPGVGKTSAAHALAADMGWEVVEVNASDNRTTETVERHVGRASRNATLGSTGRQLVIVDEADSFHRSDSGGARALSDILDDAGQPMIFIVNEEYEMPDSIRHSVDTIEFRDVAPRSIVPVLRDICRQEDIEYESAALEAIAERNSGDLRSAINDLQAVAERTEVLTEADLVTGARDGTTDLWSYLDAVLKEADAQTALQTTYEVDETPDDLVRWVEDKVPLVYEPEELQRAYEFLGNADRWLGRVRATQDYSYWRYVTDNVSGGVAAARTHTRGGFTRYGGHPYRSSRDSTRDYVARQIATTGGLSIATARRAVLPYLATMTHHCHARDLTIKMAETYDLDESEVAFVTGSGESTNKVEGIVSEARERRERAAVEGSEGAFANPTEGDAEELEDQADPEVEAPETSDTAGTSSDEASSSEAQAEDSEEEPTDPEEEVGEAAEEEEEDEAQSGLDEFI